ncbi:MAG: CoA transferase, partial [Proteobacteria bacterium]|nr:CoA transferase [Pseudomonadota bacterium]
MTGPLRGTRVVDLTAFASGPLATAVLADQGADVIKVERPGSGDEMRRMSQSRGGLSAIFATLNRNKRSIALDLTQPRGRELLQRLVESADVFVQNFRPGVIERMGFGEPELRALNRELVYVSISAFGESGPYAQRKVFDSVIQVLAGFASAQADPETGEPQLMRTMVCDKTTALVAAQAITAALLARAGGRGGQHVRLNMFDASVAFFWVDGMARQTFVGEDDGAGDGDPESRPRRPGMSLRRAADGYMTISTVPQDQFEGVCRAMGRPELIDDPRFADAGARMRHIEEMEA